MEWLCNWKFWKARGKVKTQETVSRTSSSDGDEFEMLEAERPGCWTDAVVFQESNAAEPVCEGGEAHDAGQSTVQSDPPAPESQPQPKAHAPDTPLSAPRRGHRRTSPPPTRYPPAAGRPRINSYAVRGVGALHQPL